MREPRVFVVYQNAHGNWEVDGAHEPDTDLTRTLSILKRLGQGESPVLKLTITDEPDVGGAWPTISDLTMHMALVQPAPPLPSMEVSR